MSRKIFISFSGGRTSAYMAQWAEINWSKDDLCFLFANTGKEREETLEFVDRCDKEWGLNVVWIEYDPKEEHGKKNWYKVVDFETASRNGEPFERFIAKERLPNAAYPNCSGRLKSLPMHNFVKHGLGWDKYYTAIGIRFDESHRVNWARAKKDRLLYPLITDQRIDKRYVRRFWDNMHFDLQLKDYEGNCDLCWKKSNRKLLTLISENPNMVNWWADMEQKYGEGYTFFRHNNSALDLVEMARQPFRKAMDEGELDKMQGDLFLNMDEEATCFCGEF